MPTALMESEHYLVVMTDEGILETTMKGDIDLDALRPFYAELRAHLEANAPVLFLNNFAHVGEVSLSARWLVAQKADENGRFIKRSAAYGLPLSWRLIGDVVLRVSGRTNVRAFDNREDAVAWLLEDDADQG